MDRRGSDDGALGPSLRRIGGAIVALLIGLLGVRGIGIGLSIAEFHAELDPGEGRELAFSIHNDEGSPRLLELSIADWEDTSDGVTHLRPPGTLPRSCADWMTISPDLVALDPNAEGDVQIRLRPPPSARGTYWAAIVVRIAAPGVEPDVHSAVRAERRFVVKVYATVGRSAPAARVSSVALVGWNPIRITAILENPGEVLLRGVTGIVAVEDRRGDVLMEIPVGPFHVLPGGRVERTVKGPWPLRSPGLYLIRAVFDFGAESLVAGQVAVRIDPLDLVPIGAASGPPTDLDGDGLYEDVNGDGRFGPADVEHLRAHLADRSVQRNARAFDFDNDGRVTPADAEALERWVLRSGR